MGVVPSGCVAAWPEGRSACSGRVDGRSNEHLHKDSDGGGGASGAVDGRAAGGYLAAQAGERAAPVSATTWSDVGLADAAAVAEATPRLRAAPPSAAVLARAAHGAAVASDADDNLMLLFHLVLIVNLI